MTLDEVIEYFSLDEIETDWNGDNALQGLLILSKYFDINEKDLIVGAEHDIIYSVDIEEALEAGLTDEDIHKLRKLNWMVESDYECFACFV